MGWVQRNGLGAEEEKGHFPRVVGAGHPINR